ncbi:disintegrin and metalloproteinase domain-containing protein 20-like [Molossus molossus]|uniref:disintegrin and metalloproteinase domain-containing protein 20-like n=1 Tax=Molossus molossus TaxID=27622 RepID=UPI0017462402|nr:disintegrin and metalloproteinase domain-containing protein 20-like [Molossus molossus]
MMLPAHSTLLSPLAVYGGTIVAMGEALVHMRNTLLPLCIGVFLFQYGWPLVVHSQHHGPPEVVIPLKMAGTGIAVKPPGWLSYTMYFEGQRHIVHMKVNKLLLSKHLPVFTYTDQGAILMEQPFVQNDCYYHGYVEGDRESLVVLSTCLGGFQGFIQTNDMVYEIEPKRLSTTFEHFVYKRDSEETQFPPMRCGLTDEEIARQLKLQENVNFTLKQSGYEGWWTHKRILELAVVVDHNRYLHHQSNASDVQREVCLVVNGIGMFLSSLDVDVVLMGIEIWSNSNPITLNKIGAALNALSQWKLTGFNDRITHDLAHAFVKQSFGGTVGLAYVGTVCNARYNCAVDSFLNDNLHGFAHIVSHEIGHNLGMPHDGNTCKCRDKTCIMYPTETSSTRFSNCSYADFVNTMTKRTCLFDLHNKENISQCTWCGNSVVEEGEECDCGTLDLCMKDPCCESNCTLRPGAACALGLCCKDCQIVSTGTLCRPEINECDLPEWCNGTSYLCPEDVYVQNGFPCKGGGYCYEKRCNNREEQCRKIFGKEAKSANHSCYTKMNTQGDRFGHCGLNSSTYVKCNISDSLCGRIQCKNVAKIPLLSDHSTVHWTHFSGVTCWGTDYHFGMTTPDIGDVKDGTECGAEHVCVQRKCVNRSSLLSNCSPETCNMNGICNNRQHCHCDRGWDPPSCLEKGFGGSIDSGKPPRIKSGRRQITTFLPLLLLILFFVVLGLLIWFFMVYKRRKRNVPLSPEEETLPE